MVDVLLRMLLAATLGIALVLLLRRPARHAFGAAPAFVLWALPLLLSLAPLLPRQFAPSALAILPRLTVTPQGLASSAPTALPFAWTSTLLAIWVIGAGCGFVRLLWHYVRLRHAARRGSAAWLASVRGDEPGIDARRVRMHAEGPAVLWSLPHSLLLLPEDFAQRFDHVTTRELVLRHELTHLRRGDAWWTLLMELMSALLWFHPLAWLARARFRLDQELACDATALREVPQRTSGYARALLSCAAAQPIPVLIPWLAEPQLKERISMLAKIQPGTLRRRVGYCAVALVLGAGVTLAGGQAALAVPPKADAATKPAVDPVFRNSHPPLYPVAAIKHGQQGMVLLDVTIDPAGEVIGVQVDQHGTNATASLQAAAVKAAMGWKFTPGTRAGKAVGGVVQVPVNFALDEGGKSAHAAAPCPTGDVYDATLAQCMKPPVASKQ